MSYQLDLDEYSDEAIADEFSRRLKLGIEGKCTYCSKLRAECNCKQKGKAGAIQETSFGENGSLTVVFTPEPKRYVMYYAGSVLLAVGLATQVVDPKVEGQRVVHMTADEYARLQIDLTNRVKLPETEVFYKIAMERSAEIKKGVGKPQRVRGGNIPRKGEQM